MQHIIEPVPVLILSVQNLQPQVGSASADLSSGQIAVADIHNGMVVIFRQVVKHDLTVRAELPLQQIHHTLQQFLLLVHRIHVVPPSSVSFRLYHVKLLQIYCITISEKKKEKLICSLLLGERFQKAGKGPARTSPKVGFAEPDPMEEPISYL